MPQQLTETTLRKNFTENFSLLLNQKYAAERESIRIPEQLKPGLNAIKTEYNNRLNAITAADSRNPEMPTFKSYFSEYPDVNAVFANRNGQFTTKLSDDEKTRLSGMLTDLWKIIPNSLFTRLSGITDQLRRDKLRLTFPYNYEIYRNLNDDGFRKRDDVINFLLWHYNP